MNSSLSENQLPYAFAQDETFPWFFAMDSAVNAIANKHTVVSRKVETSPRTKFRI